MESTHAHNVGLAKFANDCLYSTKNPAQMKNDKIRNAVNGFPILLYINDKLKGVYNFNLDRHSTNSYGYNKTDFPNCLCYEVSANSDTTAGAFHKWTSGSGKTELEYIASDFEVVYPPERVTNDNFVELKRLIDWVSDADDELFRQQIAEHFNLEYLLRYYLFVMVFGLVDSLGKNMKLTTWDGRIWYPQLYDADTALGLDNTGFLKFDVDIEVEPNVFNTSGSKLWSKVARVFAKELSEQYTLMRQDRFTVENIMKYLDDEQISKIPQINYNKDMQTKYLDFGSSYLYACHGNRKHHITRWIRERIAYVDTLMGYDITTSDYITVRANKQGYVYLNLQTYIPLYLKVKWRDEAGGTGTQIKKINRGETVKFEYNMPTATDQEVLIYGGRYLKDIGDVTNLQPTTMLIANAPNLTKLTVHSQNLANLDLSENRNLQHVDVSDCTILGSGVGVQSTLDIQSCTNLFELDARGTKLTAIYINTIGGNLETIRYPLSIQSIDLKNLLLLNTIDIPLHSNLASLSLTNCESLKTLRGDLSLNDTEILSGLQHCTIINSMTDRDYFDIVPHNLKTLTIKNLPNVKTVRIGGNTDSSFSKVGTLESVFFENCPNITDFFFTPYNNDNKNDLWDLSKNYTRLNAKDGLVVDLSKLNNLEKFVDRLLVQGLTELYLPPSIKNITVLNGFSNSTENLGSVSSTLKKIWCPELCTPSEDFLGFDGTGLELQDVPFTFLTNLKEVVNMNVKYINVGGRYNVSRNSSNFLVPEGTFDYSDFNIAVLNQEFANIKDTNGVMNIIFPNSFSAVNQVTRMFYNATLKNVSWDIANRLLNELKYIHNENSIEIFQGAVLSPFNTHTGLYVDNENVTGITSLYKVFKKSNLPRIEKLKINGLKFLSETFAEIPNILDNSWDVVNDIFKDNPMLEECKTTFNKTNMKPFNVYDGVDIDHNNILTIINCFRETNIDKIKRIKSTSLNDISCAFYESKNISGFTWDDVTPMFENDLPNIKEANGTFRGSSIGDTTNGFELTHNSLEKVRSFFYGCVISKINKILLPNVLDAGSMFQGANNGNPLNNSWDVVIDFLQNSPKLELAGYFCEKIKMQPQTKPLSFNLPKLIELQLAFAETNISDIGVMSCPKLQQAKQTFRRMSLPVNSKAPHNILDMITGCQSEIVNMEQIMYQTNTESTSDDVYDINWVLPNLSYGYDAFANENRAGTDKKFRYKISKLVTSANVNGWFKYQILDEYIENVELNGNVCSFNPSEGSGIEYIDGLITNNTSDFNYSFISLSKLVEVKNSLLKVSNGTNMFSNCIELIKIDKLDVSQISTSTYMFSNLPKLEEIVFVNGINSPIDLSGSHKLTVNTLIHIFNSLSNRNGMSSFTLKIGSTNIAKLTPEQLAIATSKNWIIA